MKQRKTIKVKLFLYSTLLYRCFVLDNFNSRKYIKNIHTRMGGDMVQRLRELTALAKNPSFVLIPTTLVQREPQTLLHWQCTQVVYLQIVVKHLYT